MSVGEQQDRFSTNRRGSVFLSILTGLGVGAVIGLIAGLLLRPKDELTEISNELLSDLQDSVRKLADKLQTQPVDPLKSNVGVGEYESVHESIA